MSTDREVGTRRMLAERRSHITNIHLSPLSSRLAAASFPSLEESKGLKWGDLKRKKESVHERGEWTIGGWKE